jgi:hypothetical protein
MGRARKPTPTEPASSFMFHWPSDGRLVITGIFNELRAHTSLIPAGRAFPVKQEESLVILHSAAGP